MVAGNPDRGAHRPTDAHRSTPTCGTPTHPAADGLGLSIPECAAMATRRRWEALPRCPGPGHVRALRVLKWDEASELKVAAVMLTESPRGGWSVGHLQQGACSP